MRRLSSAFTLIELLVVVAIIALLISILLPALGNAREQGKRAVCAANLRSLVQGYTYYAADNRDVMPQHEGVEPSYIYVKKSDSDGDKQWHLAELIVKYLGTQGLSRSGPSGSGSRPTITNKDLEEAAPIGKMFYCPSTNYVLLNRKTGNPPAASFVEPSAFGSFMDYAQTWNYVGCDFTKLDDTYIKPRTQDGFFRIFDDDANTITPDNPDNSPLYVYRLPFSVSKEAVRLPRSSEGSRVPVIQDYLVTVGRTAAQVKDDFQNNKLKPTAGNHLATGRAENADRRTVKGGNFGYVDGSVRFRSINEVRPRLMIDRTFSGGSTRPTYWW